MLSLSDANQSEVIEAFISTSRYLDDLLKSRKQNPQKLTHLSPRSHPRHLVGKKDSTKRRHKRHQQPGEQLFPYRWSPDSLTINIYFYTYFLYLYITKITVNNGTPHLNSLKNQNRRAALGRPAIQLLGVSTSLRSTNPALSSALVPHTLNCSVCVEDS